MTEKREATAESLRDLLKENTGSYLTDSGDFYGRHWQRNQKRDLDKEPPTRLEFSRSANFPCEIIVTVNTYQWLYDRLEFSPRMDAIFQKWAARPSNEDRCWLELSSEFPEWLAGRCPNSKVGTFDDDAGRGCTVYTYNDPNILDQDIQFTHFEFDDVEYVVLQVHGGCDARGGMSRAKVFESYMYEHGIFDYARCTISCSYAERVAHRNEEMRQTTLTGVDVSEWVDNHTWYTDDAGYRWADETYPYDYERVDLGTYRVVYAEDHPDHDAELDTKDEGERVILVDENGVGHCPRCGCSLEAYWR